MIQLARHQRPWRQTHSSWSPMPRVRLGNEKSGGGRLANHPEGERVVPMARSASDEAVIHFAELQPSLQG